MQAVTRGLKSARGSKTSTTAVSEHMCSACAWTCELVAVTFDAYIHMYLQPALNKALTRLRGRVDGTLAWRIPHWQVGAQHRGCSSGVSMPWLWAAAGAPGSAMAQQAAMSSPGPLGLDDPWLVLPSPATFSLPLLPHPGPPSPHLHLGACVTMVVCGGTPLAVTDG